ncbi:MAG: hypothetical protein A2915_00665 [Candidatus Yanofskybacteria bacterium RIFCSPLOWO2_01_FULL_41_34]|uniref:Uncharacterized protein n=1 Tax=Candidatus Yanofskybacteria bacterium RIFCSPHIGHO2_01_FULL_41_26 TaxID=1802661 RepID=A0A1F8EC16_9BACT|nr:MAG: hypothetical protein A2649_02695 [Candidatus Yanofskybacteria bacterium RIFCSPHIGHO2_01_FULL_41_26]OGN22409.1 MAG: hypothetical protein A2915_00665 [Candidatus Yanofskybacteria bacterium RIFCSPLOWO2_01_FULL_41_34]
MKKTDPKDFATELRKGGYSYSEIQKFCSVPKSTLSYWFRGIKLSEPQLVRLKKKRIEAVQRGSKIRTLKTHKAIEEIQKTSAKDIGQISKRELWLMGVVLYWRERLLNKQDSDLKKGVRFTSSDPNLIKLFLKWLEGIGRVKKEEISLDVYIGKNSPKLLNEAVDYWANVTGFSQANFSRYYVLKKSKRSLLRVRVKGSSMLARQISGWANGISKYRGDI